MEIKVSLENMWTEGEFNDRIADIVRQEMDANIRSTVRLIVTKVMREQKAALTKEIEAYIKQQTPKNVSEFLRKVKGE